MRKCFMRCFGTVASILAVSCAKETDSGLSSEMVSGTIVARWADDPSSRTAIQSDGTTVMWSGEEHIRVFFGPQYTQELISAESGHRKEAVFSGMIPTPYWPMTPGPLYSDYWALYPYDASAECNGESITFGVQSEQVGKAGSFADNFFPAIGTTPKWTGDPISFYNVCGGACFSVSNAGITSVTFKSAGGEALCGKVRAGFNTEGLPEIREVIEGVDSVIVSAPSGGFVPGEKYYAALLPQTLPHGLVMKFRKGKLLASRTIDKPIVINRSRFGRLDGLDSGLDYVEDTSPEVHDPDEIIPFEDKRIEAVCIAAFDTNGDRKLSYGEAAAVCSIESALSVSRLYTSFDEFRFFTGVTEIPDKCFENCALLKRISLPDGVKSIGQQAFQGCSSLEVISFGERLGQIKLRAFSGCSSLKHIHISKVSQWLDLSVVYMQDMQYHHTEYYYNSFPFYESGEGHLYVDGEELTVIDIPPGYHELRAFAFRNCTSITCVAFPSGFTASGLEAFMGCVNLKTVAAPSLQDWMMINWYPTEHPLYCGGGGGRLMIGGEEVTHLVIPEGTTEIPSAAFLGCSCIREVTLPRSLKIIDRCAFYMCDRLVKANLASIDAWLNLDVTAYFSYGGINARKSSSPFAYSGEGHLFIDGDEVTMINIPADCVDIPKYAFLNCTGITDICLPDGLETIGALAFDGCKNLKRVHVPSLQAWMSISYSKEYGEGGFFFFQYGRSYSSSGR